MSPGPATHFHRDYSHTPDRDFRCFYTCEIIQSHILGPACGKDKKANSRMLAMVDPYRHCNVKMKSPCRISAY